MKEIDENGLGDYWEYPDEDPRNWLRSGKKSDIRKYGRKKPDDPDGDDPINKGK